MQARGYSSIVENVIFWTTCRNKVSTSGIVQDYTFRWFWSPLMNTLKRRILQLTDKLFFPDMSKAKRSCFHLQKGEKQTLKLADAFSCLESICILKFWKKQGIVESFVQFILPLFLFHLKKLCFNFIVTILYCLYCKQCNFRFDCITSGDTFRIRLH